MDLTEITETGTVSREDAAARLRALADARARHNDVARTEREFRAQRLGFALKSLAAELVAERRKVAQLRRELAQLKARLDCMPPSR